MSYEVDVLINGRPVRKYGHEGRTYIEARDGEQYTIRVKNGSSSRTEVVTTIDGLDVITGKLGSKENRGYIWPGYSSDEIQGWRESDEKVRAFKFASKDNSYAANSEETNYSDTHCGVIAVTFYNEKVKPVPRTKIVKEYIPIDRPYPVFPKPPWIDPYYPNYPYGGTWCSTSSSDNHGGIMKSSLSSCERSFGSGQSVNFVSQSMPDSVAKQELGFSSSAIGSFDMGTEFSDTVLNAKVTTTQFERGTEGPTIAIYYASRKELAAMGVDLNKGTQLALPDPFPKDSGNYCKPPRKR